MPSPRQAVCGELQGRITAYLEGALSPSDRERLEAHCRGCATCGAVLTETRALLASLGRLGRARAETPEHGTLLQLFRERGLHRTGPRPRNVPLGLGNAAVAPGDHLAYLVDSDRELDAAADFIAAGVAERETCVLLGHEAANSRLEVALGRGGLGVAALRRKGMLHLLSGKASGPALLGEIEDRIKAAVDRGEPLVRILGILGWGRPGWPVDRELVCLEARITAAIQNLPAIVMCAYDTRVTPGLPLVLGGLECHPWTFRRGELRANVHYVPAERLLGESNLERP